MSCILQMGPLSERVQQRLSGHEVLAYWQGDAEARRGKHYLDAPGMLGLVDRTAAPVEGDLQFWRRP